MFLSRLVKFIAVAALALAPVGYAHAQTALATSGTGLTNLINNQFPNNVSGQITPTNLRQVTLDMVSSSMLGCLNSQTGVTSYTVKTSDYGCLITFSNSVSIAVTLPQAIATNAVNTNFFPFNVFITNNGAGTVTITPSGSTINGTATFSLGTGQGIWIVSDGANYQVFGGLAGSASGTCAVEASGLLLGCINLSHAYAFTNTLTFGDLGTWNALGINGSIIGAVTATRVTGTIGAFTSSLTAPSATFISETVTNITGSIAAFTSSLTAPVATFVSSTLTNLTGVTGAFTNFVTASSATFISETITNLTGSIETWTTSTITGLTSTNANFTTATFTGQLVSAGGKPSVSSCGLSPTGAVSATSTNQSGSLQTGGNSPLTACAITFSVPFSSTPKTCVISAESSAAASDLTQTFVSALTAGGWTLNAVSTFSSATFGYICM